MRIGRREEVGICERVNERNNYLTGILWGVLGECNLVRIAATWGYGPDGAGLHHVRKPSTPTFPSHHTIEPPMKSYL